MPQVGWIVVDEHGDEREVSHEDMLQIARAYPEDFPYDPAILDAMFVRSERSFPSPTTMTGCARQIILKRHVPYYVEPKKAYAPFRGTMAHTLLEHLPHEPGAILERRVRAALDLRDGRTILIAGKPDKLVPSEGIIVDYKTLKEFEYSPKSSWTPQLSSYRWILAGPHEVLVDEDRDRWEPEEPLPITRAQIQQLTMEDGRKTEIDLWPTDYAELWLRGRMLSRFVGVYDGTWDLDNLPPVLEPGLDEGSYLCFGRRDKKTGKETTRPWCPVWKECRRKAREGK